MYKPKTPSPRRCNRPVDEDFIILDVVSEGEKPHILRGDKVIG